jgi:hypothetical protein
VLTTRARPIVTSLPVITERSLRGRTRGSFTAAFGRSGPSDPVGPAVAALLCPGRLASFAAASPACRQRHLPPLPRGSTSPAIAGARCAIHGQVMAPGVRSSRARRRSDDGQTILNTALES